MKENHVNTHLKIWSYDLKLSHPLTTKNVNPITHTKLPSNRIITDSSQSNNNDKPKSASIESMHKSRSKYASSDQYPS